MKISFVGLGQMGKPMALNMLKSGAELIVSSRSNTHFAEFEKKGVPTTQDLAQVAQSHIIFLCLLDSEVVQDALFGEKGFAKHLTTGQIVVDFSTISYSLTMEIAKRLQDRGIGFLDAPISGMEARAVDGTLTVMCGGKRETLDEVRPYLECVGNKIIYMGASGSGQLTKLFNQMLYAINMAGVAEILPLAVKMGLDPEKFAQVINSGTGRSHASEFFVPRILRDHFSDGYSLKKGYKDLVSAAEISADLCAPLPAMHAAIATYQAAMRKGYGDYDKGIMVRVFEELLGVSCRKP
ncbi:NAD(P)-dependent oxidoreductase [Paralcaligenes ureilyticus]|uniref:3-hydroxyisobutyrate dehydrogenase-like beta-hydroxyacid dehydrogenase n=1 Tax=Paralcaligenes ureilyticus TaxID=627131 RepID=A0A4R3M1W4_9BURK|nr:NAD(P)-dependent oxidoreductase [Paralcaligenes ureilyticus]TCT07134.1 3-hydroxyisobutyrate dehydrogenase-like beta-hydroxyacid dehydrogenase [Paralcaligenes ureilyticus]